MIRPWAGALVLACIVAALTAPTASARWFGSLMMFQWNFKRR